MRRLVWMAGIAVCLILVVAVAPVLAQNSYPDRADAYINDFNGMMSSQLEAKLRGWLVDLKTQHNIDMTVVTINSIRDYKTSDYNTPDTSIEAFATHVFNHWGLFDQYARPAASPLY